MFNRIYIARRPMDVRMKKALNLLLNLIIINNEYAPPHGS